MMRFINNLLSRRYTHEVLVVFLFLSLSSCSDRIHETTIQVIEGLENDEIVYACRLYDGNSFSTRVGFGEPDNSKVIGDEAVFNCENSSHIVIKKKTPTNVIIYYSADPTKNAPTIMKNTSRGIQFEYVYLNVEKDMYKDQFVDSVLKRFKEY